MSKTMADNQKGQGNRDQNQNRGNQSGSQGDIGRSGQRDQGQTQGTGTSSGSQSDMGRTGKESSGKKESQGDRGGNRWSRISRIKGINTDSFAVARTFQEMRQCNPKHSY